MARGLSPLLVLVAVLCAAFLPASAQIDAAGPGNAGANGSIEPTLPGGTAAPTARVESSTAELLKDCMASHVKQLTQVAK